MAITPTLLRSLNERDSFDFTLDYAPHPLVLNSMTRIVSRNISYYNESYKIEFEVSENDPLTFKVKLYLSSNFVEGPVLNLLIKLTSAMKQIKTFYFTKTDFSAYIPGDLLLSGMDQRLVENSASATRLGQDLGKSILVMQSVWSVGSSFVLKGMMVMEMIDLLRYIDIKWVF